MQRFNLKSEKVKLAKADKPALMKLVVEPKNYLIYLIIMRSSNQFIYYSLLTLISAGLDESLRFNFT